MLTRIGMLSLLVLIPLATQAEKGQFEISVGTQKHVFPPLCIKSLHYTKQGKTDSEYLSLQLTDICRERMAKITHENMAKQINVSYQGNPLFSSMITQRLESGFRFNTEQTSRVVLMQLIKDYEILIE
ncbi:Insecticidal toxin complex protein tccz [Dickeya chrysanthemi]|uniref:Insecticidal toxin complex protein tccz n=1 Tax=Dickeya chrysanthemi TaxID=556 RepID=UPI001CF379E0|nr:Insecticidal toxin complex protein tccz [Dickeya chrysanthemi]MCA7005828.1 Insecticidal toxin complex protein tccz [Dickeya chrysanthemi]